MAAAAARQSKIGEQLRDAWCVTLAFVFDTMEAPC